MKIRVGRRWTDAQLQEIADQTTLDIMEDIATQGRDNVDPAVWALATADVENIHDDDREVFFNMLGITPAMLMNLADAFDM